MICPRCDEQGLIYKARLVNLGIELNICDECEACWLKEQIINFKNFKDLAVFLEERKLTYEESEIEDLGYVEPVLKERKRTFFNVSTNEVVPLIDEAWSKKREPIAFDLGAYLIDMKKIIGTQGESTIKIIVKPGTAEIKTAYPIKT